MGTSQLLVGNGQSLQIICIGNTIILCYATCSIILKNVLIVPHIAKKLISISKLTQDDSSIVEFQCNCCLIKDEQLRVEVLIRIHDGGL